MVGSHAAFLPFFGSPHSLGDSFWVAPCCIHRRYASCALRAGGMCSPVRVVVGALEKVELLVRLALLDDGDS